MAARIGCHVSISGSIDMAVDNAVQRGCTAFQMFTRNPRGWHAKELDGQVTAAFRTKLGESGIDGDAICAHMPYLPNLASPDDAGFAKSTATLTDEVRRCGLLGIPYVVTHLGSHLGSGEEAGMGRLVRGLNGAAKAADNDVMILLENTAGQKNSVGSDLGQLGDILGRCRPAGRFGVCLDTCHAFAAGYDLRTKKSVKETFGLFEERVGMDRLKIIHLNDAKGELGSRRDRHYHIGLGEIGEEGMAAAARTADKNGIPLILETPIDEKRDDVGNIAKTRELLAAKGAGKART